MTLDASPAHPQTEPEPESDAARRVPSPALAVVLAGAAAFTALFGTLAVRRHELLLTHAYDMGQMTQLLWKIRHLEGDFSTVTGQTALGDHARFVLYPLAFLVPSSPRLLVVLQAAVLASGAVAVYLLARRRAPEWLSAGLGLVYLAFPSLQWTALFDVHPEVLALPLLLFAVWAVDSGRMRTFAVLVGVAMLCREDVPVAVALLGGMLVLERRYKVGGLTVLAGAAGFVLASVVQRLANPAGLSVLEERYGYLGHDPVEIVGNVLLAPADTFAGRHIGVAAGMMALAFLAPVPLLLLARWTRLLAAFPLLVLNLLSTLPMQKTPYFHYGFLITVFLFVAAADGAGRLGAARLPLRVAGAAVTVAGLVVASAVLSPFTDRGYRGDDYYPRPAAIDRQFDLTYPQGYHEQAREALGRIGPGDVAVSGNLLPQVAERDEAYMMPNPFFPVWYGDSLTRGAEPDRQVEVPDELPRWVLIDTTRPVPGLDERERGRLIALLDRRYDRVYDRSYITLWELK